MSDRAQRVLDALMDYDADNGIGYPIRSIIEFFDPGCLLSNHKTDENIMPIGEDYEELTVEEEKQVINGFLESAY